MPLPLTLISNLKKNVYFVVTGLVCSAILKELSNNASNVKEHVLSKDLMESFKVIKLCHVP